jgi:nitrous oxide reductase
MFSQRPSAIGITALVAAALCVAVGPARAGPAYRYSKVSRTTAANRTTSTTPANYFIPPGAPLDRSYTWYAPPQGYEVVRQGIPSAPVVLPVVGPDGVQRAYRLEGPVVSRPLAYFVRQAPR